MVNRSNSTYDIKSWSAKDHIVNEWAVKHDEGDVEIDSGCVDWESDVPQCELLLTAKSD